MPGVWPCTAVLNTEDGIFISDIQNDDCYTTAIQRGLFRCLGLIKKGKKVNECVMTDGTQVVNAKTEPPLLSATQISLL